jgi:hypothetical protein
VLLLARRARRWGGWLHCVRRSGACRGRLRCRHPPTAVATRRYTLAGAGMAGAACCRWPKTQAGTPLMPSAERSMRKRCPASGCSSSAASDRPHDACAVVPGRWVGGSDSAACCWVARLAGLQDTCACPPAPSRPPVELPACLSVSPHSHISSRTWPDYLSTSHIMRISPGCEDKTRRPCSPSTRLLRAVAAPRPHWSWRAGDGRTPNTQAQHAIA